MKIDWDRVAKIVVKEPGKTERRERYLRRLKHRPNIPNRAVFFDSESKVEGLKHIPYIICATFVQYNSLGTPMKQVTRRYGGEQAQSKINDLPPLEAFWNDIDKFTLQKQPTYIFAHNMGYDLLATGGIEQMFSLGYVPLGHPYEEGQTFIWEMAKPNSEPRFCDKCSEKNPCRNCVKKRRYVYNVEFLSTTNFYQGALANLGRVFGLEKTHQTSDSKFDFSKIETYDLENVYKYCERDVEIIVNAMSHLFSSCVQGAETGFGGFKKTLPSMAFSAYQTWFMPENTIHIHTNDDLIQLERNAYYGGRTEVWKRRLTTETIYQLDINSMYPHVMRAHAYPTKCVSFRDTETVEGIRSLLDKGLLLIADVTLNTNENVYPLRWKKRLIFPIGRFRTVISTPEIEYALNNNHIEKLHKIAIYEGSNIFKEFVDHFYNVRMRAKQEGNKIIDLQAKLAMNSLYGKFAQTRREWHQVGECDKNIVMTEDIIDVSGEEPVEMRFRYFGGRIYMEDIHTDVAPHSNVAVAVHVTAYARILLWQYIQKAGKENHYYNDTDSLFVNYTGFKRLQKAGLIDPDRLGALKLEQHSDGKPCYFRQPKDYIFGGRRKCKGVNKDVLENQKFATKFETIQWPRIVSSINAGSLHGFANRKIEKVLSISYNKGWVKDSGDVLPLVFDEIGGENQIVPWSNTGYGGMLKQKVNNETIKNTMEGYH